MTEHAHHGGAIVANLADYVPEGVGRDAPASLEAASGEREAIVRPLTDFLAALDIERTPGAAGGVQVPASWRCVRAILGGASRADLEDAHAPPAIGGDLRGKEADELVRLRGGEGTHLPPGLHIVTGQTGGGKTALVMNLAHAAITAGHPVLYVSLELDGGELAARLLSLETGLPWNLLALHRALRGADDRERRAAGIAALTERAARFAVLAPERRLALAELQPAARELWRAHDTTTPLVVFDYLQAAGMMDSGEYRLQLREQIGRVTMALRALSRADTAAGWPGCPVVVLSTTARGNVKGENAAPGMDGTAPDKLRHADLETLKALPKEAGEVEATAVTAWVVALGEKAEQGGGRVLTLRLVKNRLGPPGQWIPFTFDGATGKLEEAPTRYASAPEDERRAREEQDASKPNGRKRPGISGPPVEEEAF